MSAQVVFTILYDLIETLPKELISIIVEYCKFIPKQIEHVMKRQCFTHEICDGLSLLVICENPFRAVVCSRGFGYVFTHEIGNRDDEFYFPQHNGPSYCYRCDDNGFITSDINGIHYHNVDCKQARNYPGSHAIRRKIPRPFLADNTIVFGRRSISLNDTHGVFGTVPYEWVYRFNNGNILVYTEENLFGVTDKTGQTLIQTLGIDRAREPDVKFIEDNSKFYVVGFGKTEVFHFDELNRLVSENMVYGFEQQTFYHGDEITSFGDTYCIGEYSQGVGSHITAIQNAKDGIYVLTVKEILFIRNAFE